MFLDGYFSCAGALNAVTAIAMPHAHADKTLLAFMIVSSFIFAVVPARHAENIRQMRWRKRRPALHPAHSRNA